MSTPRRKDDDDELGPLVLGLLRVTAAILVALIILFDDFTQG